jgi:threonine dehydratase
MSTPIKENIEQAHGRIAPYIHRTPLMHSEQIGIILSG